MPQIAKLRRTQLENRMVNIEDKGDMCYLFTSQIIIPAWKNKQKWETISQLRMRLVEKPDLNTLRHMVRGAPFNDEEILNQAALAFHEFYRRVAANYEDDKARKNGDVYAGILYSKSGQLTGGK